MNKLSQQELWEKIQNFSLDDPYSSYPFSKKLAQQNNWSDSFTQKAIEEYKKFIFLCCISPTGASPSEIVDEVWHLHLTYTKNYWIDFCRNTLNQDIHHHPSKGGLAEKEKHVNWYEETLRLYQTTFGMLPPAAFWPQSQNNSQSIAASVYDPKFMKTAVLIFAVAVLLFMLAVNLFHSKGKDFLYYYAIICFTALGFIFYTQSHKLERLKSIVLSMMPSQFTTFEITRYLYGPHRCYQTALIDLSKRDIVEISGSGYKLLRTVPLLDTEQNPLLDPLMKTYQPGDVFTYPDGLGIINTEKVKHPGFEKLRLFADKVDYPKFIIPGIVLLIGIARFIQGLSNGKPVEFLLVEIVIFTMIALAIMEYHSYTKAVGRIVNETWKNQNAEGYGENILNNFSILGTSAIAGFAEYAILNEAFEVYTPKERKYSTDSSGCGSSCGSTCGSSCCGGGCGGGD